MFLRRKGAGLFRMTAPPLPVSVQENEDGQERGSFCPDGQISKTEKALAISRKGFIVWLPETDLNRQPSD